MSDNRRDRPDGWEPLGDTKTGCNAAIGLTQAIAAPFEAWLRKPGSWGERHAGTHMALGWLALLAVPALMFPREPQGPVVLFWLATTLLLLVHRVEGVRLRWRGYQAHSRFTGVSRFTPGVTDSQITAKKVWEPVAVFLAGGLALAVSLPLGIYLMLGAVCLSFTAAYQEEADLARRRALRDARFEAYQMSRDQRDEY